jgi:predicted nucleic acid-binding protein
MRIYLDNCCYNRPFDKQANIKIQFETRAKLFIQEQIREGACDLIWSFMIDLENNNNPYDEKRNSIQIWEDIAKYKCNTSLVILNRAKIIEKQNVNPKDALNISCAIDSNCDYFITTDRKLLNKEIDGIKIINPIDFAMIMEEKNES